MKLETKREIGDKVYALHKDKIVHAKIDSIMISVDKTGTVRESYWLRGEDDKLITSSDYGKCFSAKEELLASLES